MVPNIDKLPTVLCASDTVTQCMSLVTCQQCKLLTHPQRVAPRNLFSLREEIYLCRRQEKFCRILNLLDELFLTNLVDILQILSF